MQNEQPPSENFNVLGGEVEKNSFNSNNAPVFKDNSGFVIIKNTHNYIAVPERIAHYNLDGNRCGDIDPASGQGDKVSSNEAISIKDKLNSLFIQKRELEKKLEHIESEISRIESSLKSETNPSMTALLHWLSSRKSLAEKYGKIALRGFQSLRREAEEKGNLDDFYFEIESYLELIFFALREDDKIFLQESDISPTFADTSVYENASSNAYKEIFRILKENIPKDNIELSLRSKLEDCFDELLERLQAYF